MMSIHVVHKGRIVVYFAENIDSCLLLFSHRLVFFIHSISLFTKRLIVKDSREVERATDGGL